jgi:hypothetical protein
MNGGDELWLCRRAISGVYTLQTCLERRCSNDIASILCCLHVVDRCQSRL